MNRTSLPDEYIQIAFGTAFSLEWWAPPIDNLAKLLFEHDYSILQQLILESMLRIYQGIRQNEIGNRDKPNYKNWNLLRAMANRILNYAASVKEEGKEKHVLANLMMKLTNPINECLNNNIYTRVSAETYDIDSVFSLSVEDVQLIPEAFESQSDQVELQQYSDRIANLESLINPDKKCSLSEYLKKGLELIRIARNIRMEQLAKVPGIPTPEFEFIKIPKLFLVYSRDLISIRGEPTLGEYLKCVTLLPGQSITYKIEKSMRSEITKETSTSVVDSNSTESQQSLSNELQSTDKKQINTSREQNDYFREQNHLDTSLKINFEYGKDTFSLDKLVSNVGVNVDTAMNWSNDKERSQEITTSFDTETSNENIAKAISSQVGKANTARQITLNDKTTETITQEEKSLTEITMQNVSKMNPIQIQTYQAIIPWTSYITVTGIALFASNGLMQLSTPLRNLPQWSSILAPVYSKIEEEIKKLTVRTFDQQEIHVFDHGFMNSIDSAQEITYGIPVRIMEFEINTNALIEVVKVLDVTVLDPPSIDSMNINNERIKSEIEINKATASVIYKISEGQLEVTELGKILFASKGKDPIGSAQYLRLDNDSNTRYIVK